METSGKAGEEAGHGTGSGWLDMRSCTQSQHIGERASAEDQRGSNVPGENTVFIGDNIRPLNGAPYKIYKFLIAKECSTFGSL